MQDRPNLSEVLRRKRKLTSARIHKLSGCFRVREKFSSRFPATGPLRQPPNPWAARVLRVRARRLRRA
jgi:hypothetical protein